MKDPYSEGYERDHWNRPSMDMNVRPDKMLRNIGRKDLLIPTGPGKLRMLALTFVGGVSMTLLYVFLPLLIVAILTSVGVASAWFWMTLAVAAVVFWLTLFTLAVRESAADRRYAEQLGGP